MFGTRVLQERRNHRFPSAALQSSFWLAVGQPLAGSKGYGVPSGKGRHMMQNHGRCTIAFEPCLEPVVPSMRTIEPKGGGYWVMMSLVCGVGVVRTTSMIWLLGIEGRCESNLPDVCDATKTAMSPTVPS